MQVIFQFDLLHTIIYISEALLVLSLLRIDKSIFQTIREDSWWILYFAIGSVWLIHVILMYVPEIQGSFASVFPLDIIALSLEDWLVCMIAGLIPITALEFIKFTNRRSGQYY